MNQLKKSEPTAKSFGKNSGNTCLGVFGDGLPDMAVLK
jgi:hypothetical protein